jgi:hypothetical protein
MVQCLIIIVVVVVVVDVVGGEACSTYGGEEGFGGET